MGTYAILQGTLTAGPNYDLTYVGADLVIMGPTLAVLYTGPNPVIVRMNDRVEITVEAVNHTGDVDYQWYKVSPDKALIPIQGANDPTLVIEHAALEDAGVYLCEAACQIDIAVSPEIELIVEGNPLPAISLGAMVILIVCAGVYFVVYNNLYCCLLCVKNKSKRHA